MAETVGVYKADANLEKLLRAAANEDKPVRVETDSGVFEVRVRREQRGLRRIEDYDPEKARKAWEESFGAFSGMDAEAFIAEL